MTEALGQQQLVSIKRSESNIIKNDNNYYRLLFNVYSIQVYCVQIVKKRP